MNKIAVQQAAQLKAKPQDESKLGFGKLFTDYMFAMNYTGEKGWHDARILPYGPISLDPAATCLHYGQLIFEGMKAYRTDDGKKVMFRPEQNMLRLNRSGERLCIPPVDVNFMVDAIAQLVALEEDWIPKSEGTSLYIRPFILSDEAFLGVHPSDSYLLLVILSPVGPYYPQGLAPVRIYVENEYVRSVKGGTGFTKCAGNYAASLAGQVAAEKEGFAQVLWLDGKERKYVDEVGSMNVFFVVDGKVVTPELSGSILPGITRDSVIRLLKSWNIPVEERKVGIQELSDAYDAGRLSEAFGTGTAAVISPVGELKWGEKTMFINNGEIGAISQRLYDELTGIQRCRTEDPFGWVYEIK